MLRPAARLLNIFGVNPRALGSLRYAARYLRDKQEFVRKGGRISHGFAILSDYSDQAGVAKGHYFHQDLLVACFVHAANPRRHIDIGSRVDGFVAHVAAFRPIEVLDIRPLRAAGHDNICFVQADLMDERRALPTADSVSCLHAIEHFGLGRYGDPIDPDGHQRGFANLLRMVEPGGTLYISFPIGKTNEVHFNAHRVFHPADIFKWAGSDTVRLTRFDYVDDAGDLHVNADPASSNVAPTHGCGIYTFRKTAEA